MVWCGWCSAAARWVARRSAASLSLGVIAANEAAAEVTSDNEYYVNLAMCTTAPPPSQQPIPDKRNLTHRETGAFNQPQDKKRPGPR
jgi:hypothetical protein